MAGFYERLKQERKDDEALASCIENVVVKLQKEETTASHPGMLLGKIQSGKTRAFLGVIAHSFDAGFEIAVVLTKGTKTLSAQTVKRIERDFKVFRESDDILVFDIMKLPEHLSRYELRKRLIIVSKKQHQNLDRIIKLFTDKYPELKTKKVLLVDDEADLASVRFVKNKETEQIDQGKIASQIDQIRYKVEKLAVLQVTATPYALYLQPEGYQPSPGQFAFLPKRPAFTELLPIHSAYVGGEDYFGDHPDDDPRAYLYHQVPNDEHDALRNRDGRAVREIYTSRNIRVLRLALMNFLLGVVVRRWQQDQAQEGQKKYALIMHNDTRKDAHSWQWEMVGRILETFEKSATEKDQHFRDLFKEAYADLSRSVICAGEKMPTEERALDEICSALVGGDITWERVNSDSDVMALLDENAELKLRTPYNIFIGGNILDRGITIPNLIGFYYGRNPRTMQADTVLQHSRMYGARERKDLNVTRFYTSREVYDRLWRIHELETTLRQAFENGAHERGVIFVRSDATRRVIPCAPNKIIMSDVVSMSPGSRILPFGFQSLPKTKIEKTITKIETLLPAGCLDSDKPIQISKDVAHEILALVEQTIDVSEIDWDWQTLHAAIDYLSAMQPQEENKGKIWMLGYTGRQISRTRPSGRPTNAPDTKQQSDLAERYATDLPMLLMLKQLGAKEDGWAGYPFWWPVLYAPTNSYPCVFAQDVEN